MFGNLARPLLAGATLEDRVIACFGALAGIAMTASVSALLQLPVAALPVLVAPVEATAVLLFAVPASPLVQPWPILGGNVISAAVGVTVARFVPDMWLAAGVAVGSATLIMSVLRCLHPPGGASAIFAVIGSEAVTSAGYMSALVPVGLNSLLLVLTGWLFHRISGHSYPHRPVPVAGHSVAPAPDPRFGPEDIDAALAELGEPSTSAGRV